MAADFAVDWNTVKWSHDGLQAEIFVFLEGTRHHEIIPWAFRDGRRGALFVVSGASAGFMDSALVKLASVADGLETQTTVALRYIDVEQLGCVYAPREEELGAGLPALVGFSGGGGAPQVASLAELHQGPTAAFVQRFLTGAPMPDLFSGGSAPRAAGVVTPNLGEEEEEEADVEEGGGHVSVNDYFTAGSRFIFTSGPRSRQAFFHLWQEVRQLAVPRRHRRRLWWQVGAMNLRPFFVRHRRQLAVQAL